LGKTFNSKYVHDVLSINESIEIKKNYVSPKRSAEEFLAVTSKEDIEQFYANTI
jgi:hypothetical protein